MIPALSFHLLLLSLFQSSSQKTLKLSSSLSYYRGPLLQLKANRRILITHMKYMVTYLSPQLFISYFYFAPNLHPSSPYFISAREGGPALIKEDRNRTQARSSSLHVQGRHPPGGMRNGQHQNIKSNKLAVTHVIGSTDNGFSGNSLCH